MSALLGAPALTGRTTSASDAATQTRNRLVALLSQAEPLAASWAAKYTAAWALDENIRRDVRGWSAETTRDIVRRLPVPRASLALGSALVLVAGSANLLTAMMLLPGLGAVAASLLTASGVLVSLYGMLLATRFLRVVAGHRAGIPPFRARLQQELERRAIEAIERRRETLAGPRRPVPRHAFPELLPAQAQNLAAGWMRHLGELDAAVVKPADTTGAALRPELAQLVSAGYVGRVWSFAAETPELEFEALEEAAAATGKRALLFSLSGFPAPMIARANKRGIGLFTYGPWDGTLIAHGMRGERCLRRGLRDTDGTLP